MANTFIARQETDYVASAARTTHPTNRTRTMKGWTGIRCDIDVSAFTGTSITFFLEWFDPVANEWTTLISSAAVSAAGRASLSVDPRLTVAANVAASAIVPDRVRLGSSGTITSVTWSAMLTWSA